MKKSLIPSGGDAKNSQGFIRLELKLEEIPTCFSYLLTTFLCGETTTMYVPLIGFGDFSADFVNCLVWVLLLTVRKTIDWKTSTLGNI